jgi:hypothetical protein
MRSLFERLMQAMPAEPQVVPAVPGLVPNQGPVRLPALPFGSWSTGERSLQFGVVLFVQGPSPRVPHRSSVPIGSPHVSEGKSTVTGA